MRRMLSCVVAAGMVALNGGFAVAEAQEPPKSSLVIVAHGGTDIPVPVSQVSLTCEPAGGTHPAADSACDALDEVDGDFEALRSLDMVCPLIYDPVSVKVAGQWRGRMVTFEREYSSLCAAVAESAGVFRF